MGKSFNPSIRWFEKYLQDYLANPENFVAILNRKENNRHEMTFKTYHLATQKYFGSYEPSPVDLSLLTPDDINYMHYLGFISL